MQFSMKLNKKIQLIARQWRKNEIGEDEKTDIKIKDVWAKIIPKHGSANNYGGSDTLEKVETSVTIITRKLSVKDPKIDMYFIDNDGIRYNVIDFFPNYLKNDYWDFNCQVVYE